MDKRRNNGNKGHSTKSNKAGDKRRNSNKLLLEDYIENNFDIVKLTKLMNKLYNDGISGDTKSATLFLNYTLGKPKETKDLRIEMDKNFPAWMEEE